jgi:hypothetical protein
MVSWVPQSGFVGLKLPHAGAGGSRLPSALAPGAPASMAISRTSVLIAAGVSGSTMTIRRGPKARSSNAVETRADGGKAKLPNLKFQKNFRN